MPRKTTKPKQPLLPPSVFHPPSEPKALLRRVRGLTRPGKGAIWTAPARVPPGHHAIHLVVSIPPATTQHGETDLLRAMQQRVSKLGGTMLRLSTSRFGLVAGDEITGNQHIHVRFRRRGVADRKRKG